MTTATRKPKTTITTSIKWCCKTDRCIGYVAYLSRNGQVISEAHGRTPEEARKYARMQLKLGL